MILGILLSIECKFAGMKTLWLYARVTNQFPQIRDLFVENDMSWFVINMKDEVQWLKDEEFWKEHLETLQVMYGRYSKIPPVDGWILVIRVGVEENRFRRCLRGEVETGTPGGGWICLSVTDPA
jgi:hypothetical protein